MRIETLLLTIVNLAIFALNLKLYTEYFKDQSKANRKELK